MTFVEVFSKRTGKKLPKPVPRRWLDHPILGRDLSLTPRAASQPRRRASAAAPAPIVEPVVPAAPDPEPAESSAENPVDINNPNEAPAAGDDNEE